MPFFSEHYQPPRETNSANEHLFTLFFSADTFFIHNYKYEMLKHVKYKAHNTKPTTINANKIVRKAKRWFWWWFVWAQQGILHSWKRKEQDEKKKLDANDVIMLGVYSVICASFVFIFCEFVCALLHFICWMLENYLAFAFVWWNFFENLIQKCETWPYLLLHNTLL